jgi:hypothetical protein
MAAVTAAADSLVEQLQKIGTAAYQAAEPAEGGAEGGAEDQAEGSEKPPSGDEEVVEGEFKEA